MSETTEAPIENESGSTALETLNDLFAQHEGAGNDNVTASDLQIPFLGIIQSSSDEIKPRHAKYIKGAAPGMIFNSLTGALYDGEQGVIGISCFFDKVVLEWRPKSAGGGIANRHAIDSDVFTKASKNAKGKPITAEGNDLVETAYHSFLHMLPSGSTQWTVISMKSTQLKVSKRLNSLIDTCLVAVKGKEINPPRFAQVYKLTTVTQSHADGDSFNWAVQYIGPVNSRPLFELAKAYHDEAKAKGVQAAPEDHASSSEPANKEDVPF